MKKLFVLLLILIMFFPFANSDVVSLNSGGGNETIINPHTLIEGFFSGIPTIGPICGNSVIESGEQCDDGNTVSGDGCSSTCQTEVVTPPDGGGGAGGGGAVLNLDVAPEFFNINLAINTNVGETITITNLGSSTESISISQQNLDNKIILNETSLTLAGGETKIISLVFVATSEIGIFTGTIRVGDISIPVSINVKTKLLLFDSNIIVLNDDYLVPQGNRLKTQVTLIPMGDKERLDVTLYYVIKDYKGKTYLTNSETLLIENKIDFNRNFGTGALPLGKYIIGLELVYPNGVAPSSAHFEVIERTPRKIFGKIVFFLIILILIVLIILIILWIKREREKKKQQGVQ